MNPPDYEPPLQSWPTKFARAGLSVLRTLREQSSFQVHLAVAVVVVAAAVLLRVGLVEWCLLLLCIFSVLAAETFNTALETLAKAVDRSYNPHIDAALTTASGAVLLTAIGASLVGAAIFAARLYQLLVVAAGS